MLVHQRVPSPSQKPPIKLSRLRWSAFRTPRSRDPMSWSLSQALRAPPSGWLGWWSILRLSSEIASFSGFFGLAFLANFQGNQGNQGRKHPGMTRRVDFYKERWDGMGFVLDPGFFFELPMPLPISNGAKKLRTSPICAKVAIHAQHLKMDREEMKCSSLFLCFMKTTWKASMSIFGEFSENRVPENVMHVNLSKHQLVSNPICSVHSPEFRTDFSCHQVTKVSTCNIQQCTKQCEQNQRHRPIQSLLWHCEANWELPYMENPIKMDDGTGYPYFRKPPNNCAGCWLNPQG